jgi:hypothetical protein
MAAIPAHPVQYPVHLAVDAQRSAVHAVFHPQASREPYKLVGARSAASPRDAPGQPERQEEPEPQALRQKLPLLERSQPQELQASEPKPLPGEPSPEQPRSEVPPRSASRQPEEPPQAALSQQEPRQPERALQVVR